MKDDANRANTTDTNPNAAPTLEAQLEALKAQGAFPGEGEDTPPGGQQEGGEGNEGSPEDRPEWLPEKFKSAEDLAKAYAELEKKLSGAKEDGEGAGDTQAAQEAAEAAVAKAGLDMSKLQAEFDESGDLSEASYKALEAAGIPKAMVDSYIQGQVAQVQVYETSVMGLAGGDKAYKDLVEWAGKNLSPEEIEAYDEAVNSFDLRKAKFAVESLKARQAAAVGQAPAAQVQGKNVPADGGYESDAQMLSDMNDPRYTTDPAFRAKVERKIAAMR